VFNLIRCSGWFGALEFIRFISQSKLSVLMQKASKNNIITNPTIKCTERSLKCRGMDYGFGYVLNIVWKIVLQVLHDDIKKLEKIGIYA
jgi:hypothetical protein